MQSADRIGLPQYVQSKAFSHKLWYPPNFTVDPLSLSTTADPAGSGDEFCIAADALQDKQESASQGEDVNRNSMSKKKKPRDEDVTQWLSDKVSENKLAGRRAGVDGINYSDNCGCHRGYYWGGVYVRRTGLCIPGCKSIAGANPPHPAMARFPPKGGCDPIHSRSTPSAGHNRSCRGHHRAPLPPSSSSRPSTGDQFGFLWASCMYAYMKISDTRISGGLRRHLLREARVSWGCYPRLPYVSLRQIEFCGDLI